MNVKTTSAALDSLNFLGDYVRIFLKMSCWEQRMLGPKVAELARMMIEVQFDKRSEQLRFDILWVTHEMAIRGIADSTMILSQFYDLYTEEVGIRVNIVLKELKHVLSTIELHPSEELASYLKKEVGKYLSTNIADFNEDWHKRTTQIRSIAYFEQWDNFKGAYDQALNRVSAEIDLLVLSLSRAKEKEMRAESNKNIINITGNLEAVQTGQGATTNVARIINPGGREELLQALDDIRKYLEGGGNLSGFSKEDVVDLLDDSRAEIEKPNPNGTRLMTYLMGIAAIIQTVADLKPTYEIIKVALSHFHIILP